ncbi:exported hypothetical protein [Paraburkholderia ribeironis]|uniref:Rhamnogalacturonase A/B/Epimerase-like pectate lyase domain-containing protein n=1 Tax=Paraburkholderia ribeironis TaxID=1247936 RepID=A0A1N7S5Y6_9BURK|nr:glycosyl hydrolase family 28-related protein [Paraburkholderia ribeironis]SIT42815.1 exported hypothetical protein [Paraburkholderia ribeironis]
MNERRQAIRNLMLGTGVLLAAGGTTDGYAKPGSATAGPDVGIDIRSFGAKCDGVTDDTAAFTRAIQTVRYTGRKLRVPAGVTAVTRLPLYSQLVIEGEGSIFNGGTDVQCSTVKGLNPALSVFYLADTWQYVDNVQIRNLQITGGLNSIELSKGITNLNLRDVRLATPARACIVTSTWLERCVFDHVEFAGGQIGFRIENNGTNDNYMDKCVFMNKCRFVGQSQHGILIETERPCNSNEFIGPVFNSIGRTPFKVMAPAWDWTIIDPNFEQSGLAGPPAATTLGSIQQGTQRLTVRDRKNMVAGQLLTIQGAGKDGDDLQAHIAAISGNTVSLDANASTGVVNAEVTNCAYDEIEFGASSHKDDAPSIGVTIIGAALGYGLDPDKVRYAVNAKGARHVRFMGCRFVNRPVYDPLMNCEFIGTQGRVRTISSARALPTVWRNLRAGEGSVLFGLSPTPSVYPGNPGTGAVMSLRGTGPNEQSGAFGSWSVSKTGPNRHALLQVDGDSGNVFVGPDGHPSDTMNMGIGTTEFHGARRTIAIRNGKAPSASLGDGGYLFVEDGALKYRGANGTVTVLAPA